MVTAPMRHFFKGYNCCQSVAVAFADEMGMTEKQALQISAGFGGGFGRMREVCGAFSGITLVLGALYGSDDPAKRPPLHRSAGLGGGIQGPQRRPGSIICRELLGLKQAEGSPVAAPHPEYYKKRPCPELCRMAADILAEYIAAASQCMQTKTESDH